jgi:4-carboxymuconolactone decarboxylase
MEKNRYEQGWNRLAEVDGSAGEQVIAGLKEIAPDLGRYIVEFAFGDIYCRGELDLKEREQITLASLLTLGGCEAQLEVHINGALNVGLAPKKIIEVFLQCIPYTGFPRVLNAVGVAKQVFAKRKLNVNEA